MALPLDSLVTHHARARMQQRGIAPAHVERLLTFGSERHDRHGGVIFMFDRSARLRAERACIATRAELDRLAGTYLVLANGVVATVGHRHRRLRWP